MISLDSITVTRPAETRRYWTGVAIFTALLAVAVLVVALMGSHAGLRARRTVPADGAIASVRPPIRVQFTRALDKSTVESAVSISPPVPFDVAWAENELRILPSVALQPGVDYTVTIGPNVKDSLGTPMEGTLSWRFTTRYPRLLYLLTSNAGASELWQMDADGQNARRLSAPNQLVRDFDASPDGGTIVYVVEEAADTTTLWRIDVDQKGLRQITDEPRIIYSAPHFSPTGDLLVLEVRRFTAVGDQGDVLGPPHIELRRPADGSPAGVVYGEGQQFAHSPQWSPDGTRMVFFEADKNAVSIFNFTRDILFYATESAALGPQSWSPDGNALTYSRIIESQASAAQVIAVRDVDLGTELIHDDPLGIQGEPAWSPDGQRIAYTFQPYSAEGSGAGLWTIRPDGTDRQVLATEPGAVYSSPLWSPDGQKLLFGRFDMALGQQAIWVVNADGSGLMPVVPIGYQAAWLP